MNNQSKSFRKVGQAGFSLIELMVSIAISLIVMAAALSAYQSAAQLNRVAAAQSKMNEDGQAALALLSRDIRMAGSNPVQLGRGPLLMKNPVYTATAAQVKFSSGAKRGMFKVSAFSLRGCKGLPAGDSGLSTLDGLACAGGSSDMLAVSYEADVYNTTPSEGLPTDCTGAALSVITAKPPAAPPAPGHEKDYSHGPGDIAYSVAENTYYVDFVGETPSLFCQGVGAALPLIDNVESLTLLYGVAHPTTGILAGYLSADGIVSDVGLGNMTAAQRWARVVTVRVCLVVRSDTKILTEAGSAHYLKCDGTLETSPGDLRLRQAYSTTVVLRNRLVM